MSRKAVESRFRQLRGGSWSGIGRLRMLSAARVAVRMEAMMKAMEATMVPRSRGRLMAERKSMSLRSVVSLMPTETECLQSQSHTLSFDQGPKV